MFVRALVVLAVTGAVASAASATVTEISIFRSVSARARYGGSFSTAPTPAETTQSSNSNIVMGPFVDFQTAISPDVNASATVHSNQDTSVSNGFYTGSLHADASIIGNPTGYSEASSNYGTSPSFQTTFTTAFTVDVITTGRVFGTVSTARTGQSTNAAALFLIGDILLPGTPQPALLSVQPTSAGSPVSFDQMFTFLPGHRYSITATIAMTTGGIAAANSTGNANISFTANIPATGASALLGLGGLMSLRRRRAIG